MSSASSPNHRFSAEYDSMYYDQNFTADISNKMRVPSKILVTGEGREAIESNNHSQDHDLNSREKLIPIMQVPDRIMVAGHEQHVGYRAPPRELHLEQIMTPQQSIIRVETPPRILTLEDHFFPTVNDEEDEQQEVENRNDKQNRFNHNDSLEDSRNEVAIRTPTEHYSDAVVSPTEEMLSMRRHLVKLNRRIVSLEQEAILRQQRETLAYSFGVAYFVLKALLWLHRHW